ncbi:hypothetical protein Dsin_021030 [Dipteronia sinensis]|uniref:Uncharacterized protein n=1 Tax=Dipteronia sinensis TaxID=43782 RepID=A0AAE0E5I4_9ROSI|nr:hypothetical protein Dsin_021030 [Dipteronia sinensis]
METSYMLLSVFFFLVLLVNDCSATDLKIGSEFNLVSSSSGEVDKVKLDNKADQVNKSKEGVVVHVKKISNKDNSSNNKPGSKGSEDVQKCSDDSNREAKAKEGIPKKENSSDEVKSKDVHKESGNVKDSDPSRKVGNPD